MLDKIKAAFVIIKADLADTWNRSKMYILAIAALIIALEFRKLKEFLLVYQGQQEIKKDNKEDKDLKAKEDSYNQQADALVKKAGEEKNSEKPVTDDWNKS